MAHIGDILDIANLVAQVFQVTMNHIKGDVNFGMPDVRVAINGRSADIHADKTRMERGKFFFLAAEVIIDS